MKKVSRQLGRKFSQGRLRRHRENIAQRKAAGVKFGVPPDPRTRVEDRICQLPSCGIEFRFRVRPKTDPNAGRYCNQKHAVKHVSILRMKVPDDFDLLFDLYITKNMTTIEIGKMFDTTHGAVRHRLKYLGIVARKVGASRHWICTEKDCDKPVFKLRHPQNGSLYGTKCESHYWAHRKFLYFSRYERIKAARGHIPDKVLQALTNGATTSREIAKQTGLAVKVVSTTMGHLKRRGEVESFGSVMVNRAAQILWRVSERKAA